MAEPPNTDAPAPDDAGAADRAAPADFEEFARLKPSRPPRSPIVALAVILVGGMLLFHIQRDLRYALSPSQPAELGDARKVASGGFAGLGPSDDRYVALTGIPDYRNALMFEPKGDQFRRAFFRVLGTDTRLVIRADETSTRDKLGERFVGRLRRFDEIPYAAQVRQYYAEKVHATRFLDLDVLAQRIAATHAPSLGALFAQDAGAADLTGERVQAAAATPVTVVGDYPDDLKISLSKDKFPVEEDARHEVERLGKAILGAALDTPSSYVYLVRVPVAERNAYIAKLDEHEIGFAAHQERLTVPASQVTVGADGKSLQIAATSIAWPRLASIQLEAPVVIPPDARILVENEAPSDFTWVPVLGGVLVLFVLFNLWILVATLRKPRAAAP